MRKAFFIGGKLADWLLDDPGFDVHDFRGEIYYRDEIEPYYVLKGHKPTTQSLNRKNQVLGYSRPAKRRSRSQKPSHSLSHLTLK